jgi:hypothetical protein
MSKSREVGSETGMKKQTETSARAVEGEEACD